MIPIIIIITYGMISWPLSYGSSLPGLLLVVVLVGVEYSYRSGYYSYNFHPNKPLVYHNVPSLVPPLVV
jgi:hypothetical protein